MSKRLVLLQALAVLVAVFLYGMRAAEQDERRQSNRILSNFFHPYLTARISSGVDEWLAAAGQMNGARIREHRRRIKGKYYRIPLRMVLPLVLVLIRILCSYGVRKARTIWFYCTVKVYLYQLYLKSVLFYVSVEYITLVNEMLLMISGDVEPNPGPETQLKLDDLGSLKRLLQPVSAYWIPIADQLGMTSQVAVIRGTSDNIGPSAFLRDLLNRWLSREHPLPTLKTLCQALRGDSEIIGGSVVANKLEEEFPGQIDQTISPHAMALHSLAEGHVNSPMDTESMSDDEEWNPPSEFADMLAKIAKLLNESADVDDLKLFLEFLCRPRTCQRYINMKLYEHCKNTMEIVRALVPQYINYMHTHLLRQIVRKFGTGQTRTLVKQYEDSFPRKKPLKQMRDPLSDNEMEKCIGMKRLKVMYNGDASIDSTTVEDVDRVQKTLEKNTGIDQSMIVYAKQSPGSVIFTFLIPETVVNVFSDLDEDRHKDLADHGILRIELDNHIIDLQPSQPVTKSNVSIYTPSGMKRVPITQDSTQAIYWNSEFQTLTLQVGTSLSESVQTSKLKEFLLSFDHILNPESQYIDSSLMKDAKSVSEVFMALNPQVMNFLNWGIIQKVVDAFDSKLLPAVQSYTARFSPNTQLSTLPDALSEEQIVEFTGVQRLRVTVDGGGNEWTLGDVQQVREAVEKATGIDQTFITYAYWEGGFTTHQFTFLISTSISGIFNELCEEDLAILANAGVHSLELDYDTVADNIQELYNVLPQPVVPVSEEERVRTKNFGLEHFIPGSSMEQISKEEFNHLSDLITGTAKGKLQAICSDDSLKEFAKKMRSWKDLAPYLEEEAYPGDEFEQKYLALRCWKMFDEKTATYERLVECLLTHGHVDDAKELLLSIQSPSGLMLSVRSLLMERYVQKKQVNNGDDYAPDCEVKEFTRSLGVVQDTDKLLQNLDYTCHYEMPEQYLSNTKTVTLKSFLNSISERKSRYFLIKGPPASGKTHLMGKVSTYWAKQCGLRSFALLLNINIWEFHRCKTLYDLITQLFLPSVKKVCNWIQDKEGDKVLFILDGFDRQIVIREGGFFYELLSGTVLKRSVVVITTSSTRYTRPLDCSRDCTHYEILGLHSSQITRQFTQHLTPEDASELLFYLADNPKIRTLSSFPIYLSMILDVFLSHPNSQSPTTWTELLSQFVISQHSIPSQQQPLQDTLLETIRVAVVKDDFLAVVKPFVVESAQHIPFNDQRDHHYPMPLMRFFLRSLLVSIPETESKVYNSKFNTSIYFYEFLAGHGPSKLYNFAKQRLKSHYQNNILRLSNCLYEAGEASQEEMELLSSMTAEVSDTVVTAGDIHSIFHCLKFTQDPYRLTLSHCVLGTVALKVISRHLAACLATDGNRLTELRLTNCKISDEGTYALAISLRVSHSLKSLNLDCNNIKDNGAGMLADALKVNQSLQNLSLNGNRIADKGTGVLADALKVNQSLQNLSLNGNRIADKGTGMLADALKVNQSLQNLSLDSNSIRDSGAGMLADALKVNQSLQALSLDANSMGDNGTSMLADALKVNKSLQALSLDSNSVEDDGAGMLADALKVNHLLQNLSLKCNQITDGGAYRMAEMLETNVSLQILNLDENQGVTDGHIALPVMLEMNQCNHTPTKLEMKNISCDCRYVVSAVTKVMQVSDTLQTLNLSSDGMSDIEACHVADMLTVNRSLQVLVLNNNKIGVDGITAMAAALQVADLTTIDLCGNPILDEGTVVISKFVQRNRKVKTLLLAATSMTDVGASALASALKMNTSLQELNLSDNSIGVDGMTAMADSLRHTSLTILDLGGNPISDEGAVLISQNMQGKLETLKLAATNITAEGAFALANALKLDKSLRKLELGQNSIAYVGAIALAAALRVNTTLQILDLGRSSIAEAGATALAAALRVNTTLQNLELGQNFVADVGATALACALQVNTTLQNLGLSSNFGITSYSARPFADVLQEHTSLQLLDLSGSKLGKAMKDLHEVHNGMEFTEEPIHQTLEEVFEQDDLRRLKQLVHEAAGRCRVKL